MDIRALLFDVNGTLIDIETDEGLEEIYRAIGAFSAVSGYFTASLGGTRSLFSDSCSSSVRKVPRRSRSGMPLRSGASFYTQRPATIPAPCPQKSESNFHCF